MRSVQQCLPDQGYRLSQVAITLRESPLLVLFREADLKEVGIGASKFLFMTVSLLGDTSFDFLVGNIFSLFTWARMADEENIMELKYQLLQEGHADLLGSIWADPDVILYTNIKQPLALDEVMERIKVLKVFDVFVVYDQSGAVGILGCPCIDKEKSQYGLFYQFCKSSWGKGYATKAAKWLLDYMRERYPRATILAEVVVDNVASEKILRNLEFEFDGEEDGFERDGFEMKIHQYRLEI